MRYRLLRSLIAALVRVMALFAVLNLGLSLLHADLDANWLWLGWSAAGWPGRLLVGLFAVAVLGWPRWRGGRLAPVARFVVTLVAIGCTVDTLGYYGVLSAGVIRVEVPVPMSLVCAVILAAWVWRPPEERGGWIVELVVHGAAAGVWLGGLVGSIAVTDYQRPADAIVVFGAAVWADGRPSDALRDRTNTALALWQKGLAPVLVFSGGTGPGDPISEPEAMRRMALEAGVPDSAIVLDETGLNTAATVAAVATMARARGWDRVMMVSHDYHLARVKLACVRQGLVAYTVPAVEPWPLMGKPYYVLRELVALAWYWIHPLKTVQASR